MTVCLYVCLFFFVRAGRFKRPLGGDQGGIPITFCFFAYRSFIIFGIRSFWFAHHGSRERSLLFYYDGKLCKFSFSFSFRRYCLIIQICFLIYVFVFLRPIKMAKKNSHQWAWRRLVGWMLSLAEGWLTELRWARPSKLGKGHPGVQVQKQDRYLREESGLAVERRTRE